jgi:hypothetical protein
MIIWRFSASRLLSERAEQRAQVLVAAQFFILAPFITYEAVEKLATGGETETSWLGIGLTIATLAKSVSRSVSSSGGSGSSSGRRPPRTCSVAAGHCRARWVAREHAVRCLVARPRGGAGNRGRRHAGGAQGTPW